MSLGTDLHSSHFIRANLQSTNLSQARLRGAIVFYIENTIRTYLHERDILLKRVQQ
jgi:uncharacterized protein YjbI with pentapeptide repeats